MGNQQSIMVGANAVAERIASGGITANMIVYLKTRYSFSNATGASVMFLWTASFNLLQLVGGFLSDSLFGRFWVIVVGSLFHIAGMAALFCTAFLALAKPRCELGMCDAPTRLQLGILSAGLASMALGIGGIRPCSLAFGSDQVDNPEDPDNENTLRKFRNWFFTAVGLSNIFASTAIVFLQTSASWVAGFGVPGVLMVFVTGVFWLARVHFVHREPRNIMSRCAQVAVATWRSRNLQDPPILEYLREAGSALQQPSNRLRCFNRACMRRGGANELTDGGAIREPWRLCTVKQVEEFKVLIRVLPIFACGVLFAVAVGQNNFGVLQALEMDRHVGQLVIPAGSFGAFEMLGAVVFQLGFDPLIAPLIANIYPGSRHRQKIGLGIVLSCVAMIVAALVEFGRRGEASTQKKAVHGHSSIGQSSAMALVPQFFITGVAGYFGSICQIAFYQSQFPASMGSIANSLWAFGVGLGNLLGSAIVSGVRSGTDWIGDDLGQSHLHYYYSLIAGLSFINLLCYLWFAWLYGTEVPIAWEDAGEEGAGGEGGGA